MDTGRVGADSEKTYGWAMYAQEWKKKRERAGTIGLAMVSNKVSRLIRGKRTGGGEFWMVNLA